MAPLTRGGVKDTKLEAKTKDMKEIRRKEQPFRGQTLSRPKIGMLEAKDTNRKWSQKKRSSLQNEKIVLSSSREQGI